MEEELYKENILEHYKEPQNKGTLSLFNFDGRGVNPSCGDVLEIYVLSEEGSIKDVAFDGNGCAISTAGASMLTEYIKGKDLEEVKKIKESKIYEMLGVTISPAREKCALLAYRAMQKAINK